MNRKQLIKKYIEFFKSKNHKEIPNASLIPENDPTLLFINAGMVPIVPFLTGQKHPLGKRLVNVQRCIRTIDIEEVGDAYHHTFFEMLGNWSIGDYFKEEAIKMTFEFHNKILKIPLEKYAVTIFGGDKRFPQIPKDDESVKIWLSLGIPKERIAYMPNGILKQKDNWWGPPGNTGPCGPSTEMFYWKPNNTPAPKKFDPNNLEWVEIGNNVLMNYVKNNKGKYNLSKQKNIDFGGGMERTLALLNGLDDNYLTDCWQPIIKIIERLSKKSYKSPSEKVSANNKSASEASPIGLGGREISRHETTRAMRIIADHIKAATFIIADSINPGPSEQGYIVRRLIRRAVRYGNSIGIKNFVKQVAEPVFKTYDDYEHLQKNKKQILNELEKEETKFLTTLEKGMKKFLSLTKGYGTAEEQEKWMDEIKEGKTHKEISQRKDKEIKEAFSKGLIKKRGIWISKEDAFLLYQSFGFPIELIKEMAKEQNIKIDEKGFYEECKCHQELSRTASKGKFKSGLADNSEATTKLHTAAHLLLAAIRFVLKDTRITQKGSNITPERLRLDFNFPRKLEKHELQEIEDLVNAEIQKSCEVVREEMSPKEALKQGALGAFSHKYGECVSVYTIHGFSKEICTGPHVKNTCELGKFKIKKEESSSSGVRRIKAVLE